MLNFGLTMPAVLSPEFAGAGWETMRDEIYRDRG
jgi:hypothetical protein